MRAHVISTLRQWSVLELIGILLAIGLTPSPAAAATYRIEQLESFDGLHASNARAINNRGQVIGETVGGPFLWTDGTMQFLGRLAIHTIDDAAYPDRAYGVNDLAQVVGESRGHAFLWENGVMKDLNSLLPADSGWTLGDAQAVNNAGQIAGAGGHDGHGRAYLWSSGTATDLGFLGTGISRAYGINNRGQVVGFSGAANQDTHAFLWENGVMSDLGTPGYDSDAYGINDAGQVVGRSTDPKGAYEGARWDGGVARQFGPYPKGLVYAWAINATGQVVGDSYSGHAALYTDAGGVVDLNTQIDPALGWNLLTAHGINDGGQIVGTGSLNGQYHAFRLTPLTPPSPTPAAAGAGGGKLGVSLADVRFAPTRGGRVATGEVMLTNGGAGPLTGSVGTLSGPFRLAAGGGDFSLASGQSRTVRIEFVPPRRGRRGKKTVALVILSDDPSAKIVRVPVTGVIW